MKINLMACFALMLTFTSIKISALELLRNISSQDSCETIKSAEEKLGSTLVETSPDGNISFTNKINGLAIKIGYYCASNRWTQFIQYKSLEQASLKNELRKLELKLRQMYGPPVDKLAELSTTESIYALIFENDLYNLLKNSLTWEFSDGNITLDSVDEFGNGEQKEPLFRLVYMFTSNKNYE